MSVPNLTQQISAVETASRIIAGAVKAPRSTSSEAALMLERLRAALASLRSMENGNG